MPLESGRNSKLSLMIWRATEGALIGASFICVVGTVVGLLFGLSDFVDIQHSNSAYAMQHLRWSVLIAAIAGVTVGAIGGFAARLTPWGVSLLRSIAVVAVFSGIGRIATELTMPVPKGLPSYIPTIIAALIGGAVVLAYAFATGRRHNSRPTTKRLSCLVRRGGGGRARGPSAGRGRRP
jgi:hypothetical protein